MNRSAADCDQQVADREDVGEGQRTRNGEHVAKQGQARGGRRECRVGQHVLRDSVMPWSAAHASGEAGMTPPLATTAKRLSAAPTRMNLKPGRPMLAINAASTTSVEPTYSPGPIGTSAASSGPAAG